jgi:hypothetical protein
VQEGTTARACRAKASRGKACTPRTAAAHCTGVAVLVWATRGGDAHRGWGRSWWRCTGAQGGSSAFLLWGAAGGVRGHELQRGRCKAGLRRQGV